MQKSSFFFNFVIMVNFLMPNKGFILIIFLSALIRAVAADGLLPKRAQLEFIKQHLIMQTEVAATFEQRRQGLMGRKELAQDSGMLFVYETEALRGVWMKNTLLPLDVLFLDGNGRIVSIFQNLQPCRIANCPVMNSQGTAKYMLEVNAGFIKQYRIIQGQSVKIVHSP